jgi:hypothetical protein
MTGVARARPSLPRRNRFAALAPVLFFPQHHVGLTQPILTPENPLQIPRYVDSGALAIVSTHVQDESTTQEIQSPMAEIKQQNFKNHARLDPLYHIVATALLFFLLVLSIVLLVQNFHTQALTYVFLLALAITLWILLLLIRNYPLKAQDRIIRLEERLRLSMLLSEPLRRRIPELTERQLIALRFASDDEVPKLVEQTLDKQLAPKEIKALIQNWRPDFFRV